MYEYYLSVLLITFISCSNSNNNNSNNSNRIHTTTHFEIFYTELDDKNIKEIADSLEANYSRIVTHLQSEKLTVVKINFYSNITSLQIAVQSIEPNLPIWAIGLATSVSQIHLLSPNRFTSPPSPMATGVPAH